MSLDVGDGVARLDRAEEAVVLGHVQAMGVEGIRLPEKLLRRFRALMVVLWKSPHRCRHPLPTSEQCSIWR